MTFNPLFAGVGPAVFALAVVFCAVLAFPIYFWLADRRRQGQPIRLSLYLLPIFIGVMGVVAVLLFLVARD